MCLSVQWPEVPSAWADAHCWVTAGAGVCPAAREGCLFPLFPRRPRHPDSQVPGACTPEGGGREPGLQQSKSVSRSLTLSTPLPPSLPLRSVARGHLTTVPTCSLDQDQENGSDRDPLHPDPPQQTAVHTEPRPALQPQQQGAPPTTTPHTTAWRTWPWPTTSGTPTATLTPGSCGNAIGSWVSGVGRGSPGS